MYQTRRCNHAVTGDQKTDRIDGYRVGHGPEGGRFSQVCGDIAIADHAPRRNRQERAPDLNLEIGAFEMQMEGD